MEPSGGGNEQHAYGVGTIVGILEAGSAPAPELMEATSAVKIEKVSPVGILPLITDNTRGDLMMPGLVAWMDAILQSQTGVGIGPAVLIGDTLCLLV
jgi:hypothetical protein